MDPPDGGGSGGVTPKMVMIENDPGNTSRMFLNIFWMFTKKDFFLFDRKSGVTYEGQGGGGSVPRLLP